MASVHAKVIVQAFNGLEPRMEGAFFLCVQEGGLIERHARLFETTTYSPGEDTYAS